MKFSRATAREAAFLLTFEYIVRGDESAEDIWENAEELPNCKHIPYTMELFFGCVKMQSQLEEIINPCMKKWKKERVSYISRALLLIATYEMLYTEDVPYKVALNEAIRISKIYDAEKAHKFVNGVLDAVAEYLCIKDMDE